MKPQHLFSPAHNSHKRDGFLGVNTCRCCCCCCRRGACSRVCWPRPGCFASPRKVYSKRDAGNINTGRRISWARSSSLGDGGANAWAEPQVGTQAIRCSRGRTQLWFQDLSLPNDETVQTPVSAFRNKWATWFNDHLKRPREFTSTVSFYSPSQLLHNTEEKDTTPTGKNDSGSVGSNG